MYRYLIITIFLIFLLIDSSVVLANLKTRLDRVTQDYLSNHFLNAVFRVEGDNKVLVMGAKGVANLNGEQLKANQIMPIASATKSITAAAILRLQDLGNLNVNDKISQHLNSGFFQDYKIPDWAHKISIHNLLTHTSGIVEYFGVVKLDQNISYDEANKAIIRFISSKPLEFKIGTKYKYSNTNFFLLGLIIEKVSDKSLADFFQDEFFLPLSMKSTHLASRDEAMEIQKNLAGSDYPVLYFVTPTNYDKPKFTPVNLDFTIIPYADGGVVSSAKDLIKWYRKLYKGKVLSEASYKLMTKKHFFVRNRRNQKIYTGYGVFIASSPDHSDVMIYHPGSSIGVRSEVGYIPSRNLYFAILSNVMVNISNELKSKIDMNDAKNHLDIVYFRDMIVNSILAQ